jgi:HEAT repeats
MLCDNEDSITRGNAVFTLSLHFADNAGTIGLVRACAIEDSDGFCRHSALRALGAYFRPDPETKILLRARAIEDPDESCRRAALLCFAKMLDEPELLLLASRDLDGGDPGRDPRSPITAEDIAQAAAKLNEPKESIRARYQRLAEEVPLTFARR